MDIGEGGYMTQVENKVISKLNRFVQEFVFWDHALQKKLATFSHARKL